MPQNFASSDDVNFGMIVEAVTGELEASAPFNRVPYTSLAFDFESNILQDPTISGNGSILDNSTNFAAMSGTTTSMLRHSLVQIPIFAALRSAIPAEFTFVGTSDVTITPTGTHLDGTVSAPQIKVVGDTAAFTALNPASSVAPDPANPRGGGEGVLVKVSDSAQADNNGWRRVKAVWIDATDSYIDFYPGYVGGAAGTYGAPLTLTTAESVTIQAGVIGKDRAGCGLGVKESYSWLWNYCGMVTAAGWRAARGMVANDMTLAWSGKEGATVDVPWIGFGSELLQNADPTGQGFTTITDYTPMMKGAKDLKTCAIVTATTPIVLSAFNMTGFSATMAGNVTGVDNISGTDERAGHIRGSIAPTGTIDWNLAEDVRSEQIVQLGHPTTREKGDLDIIFEDPPGNASTFSYLNNEFGHTGATPGAQGSEVSGTLAFSSSIKTPTSRTVIYQDFSAI